MRDVMQPIGRDLTMFTRHPTFFVKDKEEQRVRKDCFVGVVCDDTPRCDYAGLALSSVLTETVQCDYSLNYRGFSECTMHLVLHLCTCLIAGHSLPIRHAINHCRVAL